MNPPHVPVGFDYAAAVEKLHSKLSYAHIAEFCGYETAVSLLKVSRGATPSHPQGEAIWVLYRNTFGQRPPVTEEQAIGEWRYLSNAALKTSTA